MNKHRRSSSGIWIGMLFIVSLPLMVYSQTRPNGSAPQQEASPTVQMIGETPTATYEVIEFVPTETPYVPPFTPFVIMESTWTPNPTVPPPSTSTVVPGPTVTPMPLPKPADDASGLIIFPLAENEPKPGVSANLSLYSIAFGAKGRPQTEKQIMGSKVNASGLIELNPAPSGKQILISDGWGINSLLDIEANQIISPYQGKPSPMGVFLGWYPDGVQMLIRADINYSDIGLWLLNTHTGEHVTLLSPYPSVNIIQGGAVSPDGQKVIYAIQRDIFVPTEFWMTDTKGSKHSKVDISGVQSGGFSWSPDNTKIVFWGNGLVVTDGDGNNPRVIGKHLSSGSISHIAWSPDSKQIVYASGGQLNKSDTGVEVDIFVDSNIYLVDVNSGDEQKLLPDSFTGIDPAWSPDGSQLTFVSKHSGTSEIWLVNVDGSDLRQITDEKMWTRYPTWQR